MMKMVIGPRKVFVLLRKKRYRDAIQEERSTIEVHQALGLKKGWASVLNTYSSRLIRLGSLKIK